MDEVQPKAFAELVKFSNDTIALWAGTEVSAEAAHKVYVNACHFFKLLSGDSSTKKWLAKTVSENAEHHQAEAVRILSDLDEFLRFLIVDKAILLKAGMDSLTAEVLLYEMSNFRRKVSLEETRIRFDYNNLSKELSDTCLRVCAAADEMKEVLKQEKRRKIALKIALEVGSWGVTGANTASFLAEIAVTSGATLSVGGISLLSVGLENGLRWAAKDVKTT
jgi:hypothetical protein